MNKPYKIDSTLRERRHIIRLLDFLKRDDLTTDQMERIGRRLQKSGRSALRPLVRKLWQEKNGTTIYRYTCMLDFFDDKNWLAQLVQITLKRKDLDEDGRLALLDALHDYGVDVTSPPFAAMTGYGSSSIEGFVTECLQDGDRGLVRFMDFFIDADDEIRQRIIGFLTEMTTDQAVLLLEILITFERPEVAREAIIALGRIKSRLSLKILENAEKNQSAENQALIRRSIRRLHFNGVSENGPLPALLHETSHLHQTQVGPVDIYGSRTLLFSWKLEQGDYAAVVMLIGDSEGVINALSYRMRDEREYGVVIAEVAFGEVLQSVEHEYALALLADAIYLSDKYGYHLPPDLYVDKRLFDPESIKPDAYMPKFDLDHLEGIADRIPEAIASSNEILDYPVLEGWLLSEYPVFDAAERLNRIEKDDSIDKMALANAVEQELQKLCTELIVSRKPEFVKRLLLNADYMQQTGNDDSEVQRVLATALSLVGGIVPDTRHPFIRRLLLDSLETARQALEEGFDLRLEEGLDNEY